MRKAKRNARYAAYDSESDKEYIMSARENIIVDLRQDTVLQSVCDEFEKKMQSSEKSSLSFEELLQELLHFVREVCFIRFSMSPEKMNNSFPYYPFGSVRPYWLLGDIIATGYAECRHIQLLTKMLAERIGIEAAMVRGQAEVHYKNEKEPIQDSHGWVTCIRGNWIYLMDPALNPDQILSITYLDDSEEIILKTNEPKDLYKMSKLY